MEKSEPAAQNETFRFASVDAVPHVGHDLSGYFRHLTEIHAARRGMDLSEMSGSILGRIDLGVGMCQHFSGLSLPRYLVWPTPNRTGVFTNAEITMQRVHAALHSGMDVKAYAASVGRARQSV